MSTSTIHPRRKAKWSTNLLSLQEDMKWSAGSSPSKGPKRLCKFCLLGVALPVLCLIVPVYVRFQVGTLRNVP